MGEYMPPRGLMPHRAARTLDGHVHGSQPVLAAREFYADDTATLLVLSGNCGTGKTVAACMLMRMSDRDDRASASASGRRMRPSSWVSASEISRVSDWHAGLLLSDLKRPALLVIDEIGNEPSNERSSSILQDVISERHNDDRVRTVLTSNLPPQDFKSRYGDRIRSRVRESGLNTDGSARWWIDCEGVDMRGTVLSQINIE